jgi:hypothetical protein
MPSPSRAGDIGEMIAVAFLLAHGYEVFRNQSSCGPIDLVIIKDGNTTLIDVKAVAGPPRYPYQLRADQIALGVKILFADRNTHLCSWTHPYAEPNGTQ